MTSNPRHSLPPRLMAHQPTRFATAQESTPSPSPGIRMMCYEGWTSSRALDSPRGVAFDPEQGHEEMQHVAEHGIAGEAFRYYFGGRSSLRQFHRRFIELVQVGD